MPAISPLATIETGASIGEGVAIGPYTLVHANVEIGDDSRIDSHCVIGQPSIKDGAPPLRIGPSALVRSHSVLYEGSTFGPGLRTGHGISIREGTQAGARLQVGTHSDLQGDMTIGDDVRTQSKVLIAQNTIIGDYVWMFPFSAILNDPHPPSDVRLGVTVEPYAVIASHGCILPGVTIGRGSLVAAQSLVTKDVSPDTVVAGVPARALCPTNEVTFKDGSGRMAYPWTRHFHRGYPDQIVQEWKLRHADEGA